MASFNFFHPVETLIRAHTFASGNGQRNSLQAKTWS